MFTRPRSPWPSLAGTCGVLLFCLAILIVGCERPDAPAASRPPPAEGPLELSYRLTVWKTLHFPTLEAAEREADVLEGTLGCEVLVDTHEDHWDVSYHCPEWTRLAFGSPTATATWRAFLLRRGFEVD